jgi:hypothetical protein
MTQEIVLIQSKAFQEQQHEGQEVGHLDLKSFQVSVVGESSVISAITSFGFRM